MSVPCCCAGQCPAPAQPLLEGLAAGLGGPVPLPWGTIPDPVSGRAAASSQGEQQCTQSVQRGSSLGNPSSAETNEMEVQKGLHLD